MLRGQRKAGKDPKYHLVRGDLHVVRKEYDKAVHEYTLSILKYPKEHKAYLRRADIYNLLGKKKFAIDDYYDFLSKFENQSFIETITTYKKLIELDVFFGLERTHIYYSKMGDTCIKFGSIDSAINAYDNAIQVKPDEAIAHINRGNAFLSKGNLYRAVEDYQRAFRLNPTIIQLLKNKKKLILEKIINLSNVEAEPFLIDYLNPRTILGKIARLSRKGLDCDESRGTLLKARIRLDSINQAKLASSNTVESDCHFPVVYSQYYKTKITEYTSMIAKQPNNVNHYINRGNAHRALFKFASAIHDYHTAILQDANHAEIYYQLGLTYEEINQHGYTTSKSDNLEEAILNYTKAISLNLKYTQAYLKRGDAFLRTVNLDKAIADYQIAYLLDETLISKIKKQKDRIFNQIMALNDEQAKPLLEKYLDKNQFLGKIAYESRSELGIPCHPNHGTLKQAKKRLKEIYRKEHLNQSFPPIRHSKNAKVKLFDHPPTTNTTLDDHAASNKFFPV